MRPPETIEPQQQRRQRIAELLGSERLRSQAELQQRLVEHGIEVTQATLSRALRELGVVKGANGYELPNAAAPNTGGSLFQAARTWLVSATAAQNLVVLRTPAGGAQPLGLALDRGSVDGLLGTIAGDDTVLAICRSTRDARALVRRLQPSSPARSRAR